VEIERAVVLQGLSEAEARARRAAGQGNNSPLKTSRTYAQIVRENVFNTINNILFGLGVILIALGRYLDAVIVVAVVMANTVVSLVQEVRAKRMLDRIAILTRPKAKVVRDGREREVDPGEIVLGDLLRLDPGDQVVVDGSVVGESRMELDESLLTGESDLVHKEEGGSLLSGSFVVNGSGYFVAEKVGTQSFASRLTVGAQAFRRVLTPLQRDVNLVVRSLLLVVMYLEIIIVVRALVNDIPFVETVRQSTVIVALVPNGLVLAIAVAYALGAVRMAGKGALIQQSNAVESLSHVDVLCTDKTGTLTTNQITAHDVRPLGLTRDAVLSALGDYALTTTSPNRSIEALARAYSGGRRHIVDEVVFSSARKWSALSLADRRPVSAAGEEGSAAGMVLLLGAPEVVAPLCEGGASEDAWRRQAEAWAGQGLRVLLLAWRPGGVPLHDQDGELSLPADLTPAALLSLKDELRPKVRETLEGFRQAGIALKIISGDNPQTVSALARQAGFQGEMQAVSGVELEGLTPARLGEVAESATIFGRVSPRQKEALVGALRGRGHYVAMIGDGVNDVISLKRSDVAIAMESGTQAARSVADMILLNDSFGALPYAFREGQRVVNGMFDILRIFTVRLASKALLIMSVAMIGGFPFFPRQSSLLSFFAAGVPSVALAYWAPAGARGERSLLRPLFRFSLPPAVLLSLLGVGAYLGFLYPAIESYESAHPAAGAAEALEASLPVATTATTALAIFCSLLLLPLVVPPTRFFTGGEEWRGDWRPTILGGGLLLLFGLVMAMPLGRTLWDMTLLPPLGWLVLALLAILWALCLRRLWRWRLLERFLAPTAPKAGD